MRLNSRFVRFSACNRLICDDLHLPCGAKAPPCLERITKRACGAESTWRRVEKRTSRLGCSAFASEPQGSRWNPGSENRGATPYTLVARYHAAGECLCFGTNGTKNLLFESNGRGGAANSPRRRVGTVLLIPMLSDRSAERPSAQRTACLHVPRAQNRHFKRS